MRTSLPLLAVFACAVSGCETKLKYLPAEPVLTPEAVCGNKVSLLELVDSAQWVDEQGRTLDAGIGLYKGDHGGSSICSRPPVDGRVVVEALYAPNRKKPIDARGEAKKLHDFAICTGDIARDTKGTDVQRDDTAVVTLAGPDEQCAIVSGRYSVRERAPTPTMGPDGGTASSAPSTCARYVACVCAIHAAMGTRSTFGKSCTDMKELLARGSEDDAACAAGLTLHNGIDPKVLGIAQPAECQ